MWIKVYRDDWFGLYVECRYYVINVDVVCGFWNGVFTPFMLYFSNIWSSKWFRIGVMHK